MPDSELKELLSSTGASDVRPLFLSVERSLQEIRENVREVRDEIRQQRIVDDQRWASIDMRVSSLEAFRIRGMTIITLVTASVGPAIWIWAAHH